MSIHYLDPLTELVRCAPLDAAEDGTQLGGRPSSGDELINRHWRDITIAEFVAAAVGYTGTMSLDTSRPDGTPRKLLDVSQGGKIRGPRPR